MDFKEFAQRLRPCIGGETSPAVFVSDLFSNIVEAAHKDVFEGLENETFKSYYHGNTGISKISQKIGPYVDPSLFDLYISNFSDAVAQNLVDSFIDIIPDINAHNVGEKLSEMFAKIIREAAAFKRKRTKKTKQETVETETRDKKEENVSEDKKITVIQHQTNIVQNGENNLNLTNNGIMNFNF